MSVRDAIAGASSESFLARCKEDFPHASYAGED